MKLTNHADCRPSKIRRALLLTAVMLIFAFAIGRLCVFAAEGVVYLDSTGGDDSKDGTSAATAKKTLNSAISAIADNGGRIVLTSDYKISGEYTEPAHKGGITVSAENGAKLVFASSAIYRMNGALCLEDLSMECGGTTVIAAQFNELKLGGGLSIKNGYTGLFIVGGYEKPDSKTLPVNKNSKITVESGEYKTICGFTRTKGVATAIYKGTANITVNGGRIAALYGGPLYNHAGGNAQITVNGGMITTLYTGGDVTRRLDGKAVVSLNGGTVGELNINNVVGNATVSFMGGNFGKVLVSYGSDTVKKMATDAGSEKTAEYNATLYTEAQIKMIASAFDSTVNSTVVTLSKSGTASASTLEKAFELVSTSGGKIKVSGTVNCNSAVLQKCNGSVVIEGENGAVLEFADKSVLEFKSPVTFDGITVSAKGKMTVVSDSELTLGGGALTAGTVDITVNSADARLTVSGGDYGSVILNGANGELYVSGGSIKSANANCGNFSIYNGKIDKLEYKNQDSGKLQLFGGSIGEFKLCGNKAVTAYLGGCSVGKVSAESENVSGRELVSVSGSDEKTAKLFESIFGNSKNTNIVYLADGGKGDGTAPASPIGSITEAVKKLGGDGYIVLCGNYTLNNLSLGSYGYNVTITSSDGMTDYNSSLIVNISFKIGGNTTLENINIQPQKSDLVLYGMGYDLVLGKNITVELTNGNADYLNICAGNSASATATNGNVRVESGEWGYLIGGNVNKDIYQETNADSTIVINGGIFHKYVSAANGKCTKGNTSIEVNGGTLYGGIYGIYFNEASTRYYTRNIDITVNGGTVYFQTAPANIRSVRLAGRFNVTVNGGDFSHLTDLLGTEKFTGEMKSEITVSKNVDIGAKESGKISFQNYLRVGADPWIFSYDGYYYYAGTGGILHKVANIADLEYSTGYKIYSPVPKQPYSHKMWSPEIHHFTEEEVGRENAGWYLFICCDDGSVSTTEKLAAFVLKCFDGDDLLGRWGHPVTGEVNVPAKMYNEDDPTINNGDTLFGGMSVIKINGKTYITYVSEEGRGAEGYHQTISITEMKTPWIMTGKPEVICVPEYSWEKGGYGKSSTEDKWWPMVVEGSTAAYGDNGEIYIAYSGSGYWTTQYNLALLTYNGGDPMSKSSWVKSPKPFLSLSNNINGCGHASYFTDTDGNGWVTYHAYVGKDTSSGRFIFVEPYKADSNGITVGNGSGHPNDINTVYTVNVNPKALENKIVGFDKMMRGTDTGTVPATTTAPITGGNDPVSTTSAVTGSTSASSVSADTTALFTETDATASTDASAVTTASTAAGGDAKAEGGIDIIAVVAIVVALAAVGAAVAVTLGGRKKK